MSDAPHEREKGTQIQENFTGYGCPPLHCSFVLHQPLRESGDREDSGTTAADHCALSRQNPRSSVVTFPAFLHLPTASTCCLPASTGEAHANEKRYCRQHSEMMLADTTRHRPHGSARVRDKPAQAVAIKSERQECSQSGSQKRRLSLLNARRHPTQVGQSWQ